MDRREPPAPLETPTQSAAAKAVRADVSLVRRMLREETPEESWRALGESAVIPLVQVANAAEVPMTQRRAAVHALGVLAIPDATGALRAILEDRRAPEPLRIEATEALARVEGQAALPQLLPLIAQGSAALCAAAADALSKLGGEEVREALETRLEHEVDPELRARLQRSLTRLHP